MTVAFFSDKVRWWECEGASDGPGEPSYALWGHGGRPRRPPDGPDGLERATRRSRCGKRVKLAHHFHCRTFYHGCGIATPDGFAVRTDYPENTVLYIDRAYLLLKR